MIAQDNLQKKQCWCLDYVCLYSKRKANKPSLRARNHVAIQQSNYVNLFSATIQ